MPSAKEVVEKMSDGWTVSDKIDEMRGKFQLKRLCKHLADKMSDTWTINERMSDLKSKYRLRKKDREAYQDSSTKDIRHNEKYISFMRQDNRNKRINLAQHENGDERVIKTVFENEREEKLSLQRYTASEAIEEMDQKSCEGAKYLNALRHEREKRQQKLDELANEYDQMIYLEQKSPEQLEAEQSTTYLENALDKALIKYDTARIISRRYGEILDRLKDDSLTLPARLEAMEQALLSQKQELKELKDMAKDAMQIRDETKRQLQQVEYESIEARRQRDTELTGLRKEVERRKIDTDKSDKKHFRASLLNDQQDLKAQGEQQQKRERQKKILSYEEAIQRIKEATHVNDIGDVVDKVLTQQDTKSKLKERVSELEGQTNRLRDEFQKMKIEYHDLKYSGNRKLSKGQQLLEKTQDHVDKENCRQDKISDSLERGGDTMVKVKTGIVTLLEKLSDIKLPAPHFNYVKSGDIFDQVDLSRKKLEHLMREIESEKDASQVTSENFVTPEFQDFLEAQLPSDNTRVKTLVSETNISEFGFESQENDVLSRDDIKKMCQRLIDSKEKKQKKKKPKKK